MEQKAIGKQIKNLDVDNWRQHAQETLLPGLTAKFQQNKHCLQLLLATDQRYIIEANQNDLFFGAGVSLFSRDVWDVKKHQGKNILGKMLAIIRKNLKQP